MDWLPGPKGPIFDPSKMDVSNLKMIPAVARFSPAAILAVELSRRGLKPGTEEFEVALKELVAIVQAVYKAISEEP